MAERLRVGVAHAEALARAAVPEELAAGGAVEAGVAHDGAVLVLSEMSVAIL